MSLTDSPRRLQLLTGIVLIVVFAIGTVFGFGLHRVMGPPPPGDPHHGPPPHGDPHHGPPGGPGDHGPIAAMARELNLTAAQSAALEKIQAAHHAELDAVAIDSMTKARAIFDAIENELRPLLTPDQVKALEVWHTKRPPTGGPGGPPPGEGPLGPPPGEERPPWTQP